MAVKGDRAFFRRCLTTERISLEFAAICQRVDVNFISPLGSHLVFSHMESSMRTIFHRAAPKFLTLVACAIIGAMLVSDVRAQPGPAAPTARGRGARGGFARGPATPPGPPAPVPPEVAIPRPSTDELAKINADLKQFVETSPDKELLQKYESLLKVQMPRDNPCIRPTQGGGNRHQGFVTTANTGDFDILFDGDSITDLWNVEADPQGNPGGKRVLDKYFGDVKVANFGISGDSTQGVLWRLQNGEGQGHKPKAVMLMIGTNNTGGASGPEIAEGIGAVVLELRKDFPDAKIMLLAIFPRGSGPSDANRRKVEEANKIIAKLHDGQHVFFVNINDKFLNERGGLIGFRPADNLHPVEEGYEIWASSVAPTLKSWVK
jgi:lysophospholipase L1-like esterase